MGLLYSPFTATINFVWGMEVIIGYHKDEANPFYWDSVVQNCPGANEYDLSMPRLYRLDSKRQVITAACKTFVDDLRLIAGTHKLVRDSTHPVETFMGYLVLQDATRKRHSNSQTPWEWTGFITSALENVGLFLTISDREQIRTK